MVALDAKHQSNQSAKSVYPLAIANCKEKRSVKCFLFVTLYIFSYTLDLISTHAVNKCKVSKQCSHLVFYIPGIFFFFFLIREDLRKLFDSLNKWKNDLKQNGILVDGKHYHVKFKGTFFIQLTIFVCF